MFGSRFGGNPLGVLRHCLGGSPGRGRLPGRQMGLRAERVDRGEKKLGCGRGNRRTGERFGYRIVALGNRAYRDGVVLADRDGDIHRGISETHRLLRR